MFKRLPAPALRHNSSLLKFIPKLTPKRILITSIPTTIGTPKFKSTISTKNIPTTEDEDSLRWKIAPDFSPSIYKDLTKARLSALVILTTMCGYALAPCATNVITLAWTTVGTGLCVASANSINQWIESPFGNLFLRNLNN